MVWLLLIEMRASAQSLQSVQKGKSHLKINKGKTIQGESDSRGAAERRLALESTLNSISALNLAP